MFNKTKEETRIIKNRAALLEGENTRLRQKIENLDNQLIYERSMVNYYKTMSQANLDVRIQLEAQIAKMTVEVNQVETAEESTHQEAEMEKTLDERDEIVECDEGREARKRLDSDDILPEINLSPNVALRPPIN